MRDIVIFEIPKKIGPDDDGNEYPLSMTPEQYFQEIIDQGAQDVHGIASVIIKDDMIVLAIAPNQVGPLFLDYALAVQIVTQEQVQPVIEE